MLLSINIGSPRFCEEIKRKKHMYPLGCALHRSTSNVFALLPSYCRYFKCMCVRCTSTHDLSRGFRCPRCYRGTVHPTTPQFGISPETAARASKLVRTNPRSGIAATLDTAGVSACNECGAFPTVRWLESAEKVEMVLENMLAEFDVWENAEVARVSRSYQLQFQLQYCEASNFLEFLIFKDGPLVPLCECSCFVTMTLDLLVISPTVVCGQFPCRIIIYS